MCLPGTVLDRWEVRGARTNKTDMILCPFAAMVYGEKQKRIKQMNWLMTNCGKCYEGSKQAVELENNRKEGPHFWYRRWGSPPWEKSVSWEEISEGSSHAKSRCKESSRGSPGWSIPCPTLGQRDSHSVCLGVSEGDETAMLWTGTFWGRGQGASPLVGPFFSSPYHCSSLCVEKTNNEGWTSHLKWMLSEHRRI